MSAIVVASKNGRVGIRAAVDVLRRGGSALDAVETGCRLVEDNLDDHTVGSGGLPNLVGELELDASIMDGATLAAGAVACLKDYPNPISVARRVMTDLPHVLLVGDGAARFAAEAGFEKRPTLTSEAMRMWQERMEGALPSDATTGDARMFERLWQLAGREATSADGRPPVTGTVTMLARDRAGNIASGASTSGWELRHPGRAADSAVIGAGNYCDNRYGAAACNGRGEMAIRASTARSVVLYQEMGMSLEEALRKAMLDIQHLRDPYYSMLHVIALDAKGNHAAASNVDETYVYMTDDMDDCVELPRVRIGDPEEQIKGMDAPGPATDDGRARRTGAHAR